MSALTLVPSPVLHWQWATTVWAWLLETVGIHRTVAANPELFENVLADVGITARARRMRPFSAWVQGRTSMEPGAGLPGMNAQGGRSFGLVRAPLTAATEQALSQLATQAREAAEVSAEARANLSAQRAASPHAAPHSLPRVASTTTLAERPSGHDVPGEGRRQQTGTLSVVPRRATTHGPATEGGVVASLEPSRVAASSRERAQRGGGPRRGRGRGRSASDGLNAQAQHNRRAALDEAAARRRTSPAAEGSTASAPGTAVLPVLGSEVALVTLEPVGIGQRFCGADSPPLRAPADQPRSSNAGLDEARGAAEAAGLVRRSRSRSGSLTRRVDRNGAARAARDASEAARASRGPAPGAAAAACYQAPSGVAAPTVGASVGAQLLQPEGEARGHGSAPLADGQASASSGQRPRAAPEGRPSAARPQAGQGCRTVVLLSLFDGLGIARWALETILRSAGLAGALRASWAVEIDEDLNGPVRSYWERQARDTGTVPHLRAAGDVWDLLREGGYRLRVVLDSAPVGSLLLIIAGSPY